MRQGWLAGPKLADRRAALVDALMALEADPATPPRERLRVCRILLAMMEIRPFSRVYRAR